MRSFPETQPIGLSPLPSASSPSKAGRFLFLLIILYYLPPLLLLSGHLPFTWRFQILAFMTVIMLAYDWWHGLSLRELGFRTDNLKGSLLLNSFVSLLLVLFMFLSFKAGLIRTPTAPVWKLFFAYYLLISSPSQEFLFRSNLFALMHRHNIRGAILQVIVAAATFSFLHVFYKDPLILVATFAIGILWGVIYYKYPNFWGVALSHAVVGVAAILTGLV
ncbi:MAG: CPBP family intramembrane metalloprotease [Pyrinomonadaceae bacterium]|nr:CPBP family intramembrane metalloprotease [Pyrinomonadaceae bacterium]